MPPATCLTTLPHTVYPVVPFPTCRHDHKVLKAQQRAKHVLALEVRRGGEGERQVGAQPRAHHELPRHRAVVLVCVVAAVKVTLLRTMEMHFTENSSSACSEVEVFDAAGKCRRVSIRSAPLVQAAPTRGPDNVRYRNTAFSSACTEGRRLRRQGQGQ